MKKLTLPRLASAVLGALFFLAACIVLAVRLVRGEAGLTDAARPLCSRPQAARR